MNKIDLQQIYKKTIDADLEIFCEAVINKLKNYASLGMSQYSILTGQYGEYVNHSIGIYYQGVFMSSFDPCDLKKIKHYIQSRVVYIDIDITDKQIIFTW